MDEPLSPDHIFDFPADESKPHPAYDFFAPEPLPGYAGNPNNNNGWIEADVPLLGEFGVVADEPMVGPMVDEIAESIVEAEEQIMALVVNMDEDIAMLFGDDDFKDDASEGFDEEEVWEVNEEWLMAPFTPPLMLAVPPPSIYEVGGPSIAAAEGPSPPPAPGLPVPPSVIEDLSTRLGNLEYGHGQLVKKVIQLVGVSIEEYQLRVFFASCRVTRVVFYVRERVIGIPMVHLVRQNLDRLLVHVAYRWEQVGAQVEQGQLTATYRDEVIARLTQQVQALQAAVQQRDTQIHQLRTTVLEMSSWESTLIQCILGMDRRLAELGRRPLGPQ
ncbi:hypothetical protein Tco_1502626 [Tanacetum coccineum]